MLCWLGAPSALRNNDAVMAAIAGVVAGVKMPVALLDKYLQTVEELRVQVLRVSVLSATSYIVPGYTLVEAYCALAFTLVIFPSFHNIEESAYFTAAAVAITFGGAWRLMSMVDNPFAYGPIDLDSHAIPTAGTAVFLGPLIDHRRLLIERLGDEPPAPAAAAQNK